MCMDGKSVRVLIVYYCIANSEMYDFGLDVWRQEWKRMDSENSEVESVDGEEEEGHGKEMKEEVCYGQRSSRKRKLSSQDRYAETSMDAVSGTTAEIEKKVVDSIGIHEDNSQSKCFSIF
jgi:hypothetical protein